MSVSLYYNASRDTALTAAETAAVEHVVAARQSSFPYPDEEEGLYLYENKGEEPTEIVAGSTKIPSEPERMMPVLIHVLASVTELRRTVSKAEWRVHLDDFDLPWDEKEGYFLPA